MKKETIARISRVGFSLFRSLLIAEIAILFFFCCRIPMRELDAQAAHRIVSVFNAILAFFCFQTIVRTIRVHDMSAYRRAYEAGKISSNFFRNIGYALTELDFWMDALVFIPIALPIRELPTYFHFHRAFFYGLPQDEGISLVLTSIITHAFLFLSALVAYDSVKRAWAHRAKLEQYYRETNTKPWSGEKTWRREIYKKRATRKTQIIPTLTDLGIAAVVYTLAPAGIWMIVIVAVPFIALFGYYTWLLGLILIAIAFLIAYRYLRAIWKRRKFVRDLTHICREKGIPLSPIKAPYRSLFTDHIGENFSIEYKGEWYDCKLLGSFSRMTPYLFSPKGYAICRRNITVGTRRAKTVLFHIDTETVFAFSGEGKKVIVLLPIPSEIYSIINDVGGIRPLDTGDRVGDYRVYNASAFLGALERDFLDRH